jgi:hypothetical protein
MLARTGNLVAEQEYSLKTESIFCDTIQKKQSTILVLVL